MRGERIPYIRKTVYLRGLCATRPYPTRSYCIANKLLDLFLLRGILKRSKEYLWCHNEGDRVFKNAMKCFKMQNKPWLLTRKLHWKLALKIVWKNALIEIDRAWWSLDKSLIKPWSCGFIRILVYLKQLRHIQWFGCSINNFHLCYSCSRDVNICDVNSKQMWII